MEGPEVRYVITDDDVRIAYQDFGSGPPAVFVPNLLGHLEGYWEFEVLRRVFERWAANLRVLMFDHRGNGMSDGFSESPSLEDRALDIKAVMDAVGTEQAGIIGFDIGAQVAVGFAAQYPERVDRLVLTNCRVGRSARARASELFPLGEESRGSVSVETNPRPVDMVGIAVSESATAFSPSLEDHPDDIRSLPRFQRLVGSRDVYQRQIDSGAALDIGEAAPLVRAPTLIVHVSGNRLHHVGYGRALAELIPDSTLQEVPGDDYMFWYSENWREVVDAGITFITDAEVDVPADRRFGVVLFTDIVGSTTASLTSGDDEWNRRLDTHDRISGQVITRYDGSIVKSTGDGILATFSTPSRAVDAVIRLRDELSESGIRVRAGLHAGEFEVRGDDISGAVVNLAARAEQAASAGDIYTTRTIRDMLIGSLHGFEHAGSHQLKGFEGDWELYRVVGASTDR